MQSSISFLKVDVTLTKPLFDEQYVDYGMNKLIWIYRLRLLGYKFRVLLHSFSVHVPHPRFAFWAAVIIVLASMVICVQSEIMGS